MGSRVTTKFAIASDVAVNATIDVPYPFGFNQAALTGSEGGFVGVSDNEGFRQGIGAAFTFGASNITIQNTSPIPWPGGTVLNIGLSRTNPRGSNNLVFGTHPSNAAPAQGGGSPPVNTAPSAFSAGQWSIADAATGGTATVTVSALPSNGGSAITAIQYQVGAGAWTASGISAPGTFNISGLTNGAAVNVKLRAVNAIGNGPDSDTKSVTPTAGAQMVAFADDFSGGANNTDLSARQGWTKVDGGRSAQTTGASSVKHVAGSAPDSAYVVTDLQTPKHYVECTWQSTANSTTFGIAGRMIDGANYAAVRRNGTQWQLFTCIGGAFTQLGSSPQEVVVGDKIRMEFDGDFVTCYRNDVVFIGVAATQMNAPSLATATKAGTLVRAAVAPLIGNFKAGGMA